MIQVSENTLFDVYSYICIDSLYEKLIKNFRRLFVFPCNKHFNNLITSGHLIRVIRSVQSIILFWLIRYNKLRKKD